MLNMCSFVIFFQTVMRFRMCILAIFSSTIMRYICSIGEVDLDQNSDTFMHKASKAKRVSLRPIPYMDESDTFFVYAYLVQITHFTSICLNESVKNYAQEQFVSYRGM